MARISWRLRDGVIWVYGNGMNDSINDSNLDRIRRKVESSRYSSFDDVLDSALALLDEHDGALERELADMRASVRRGTEQADAGEVVPASEVFAELRRRGAAATERTT